MYGGLFPPPDGGPWVEFVIAQFPAGIYVSTERGIMRTILKAYCKLRVGFSTDTEDDAVVDDLEEEELCNSSVLHLDNKFKPIRQPQKTKKKKLKHIEDPKKQEQVKTLNEIEGGAAADCEDDDDSEEEEEDLLPSPSVKNADEHQLTTTLQPLMGFQADTANIEYNDDFYTEAGGIDADSVWKRAQDGGAGILSTGYKRQPIEGQDQSIAGSSSSSSSEDEEEPEARREDSSSLAQKEQVRPEPITAATPAVDSSSPAPSSASEKTNKTPKSTTNINAQSTTPAANIRSGVSHQHQGNLLFIKSL